VGGTGLYLRTLLEGIAPVPPIHEHVREKVRALPVTEAWDALRAEDPEAALLLQPADRQRVCRALEVVRSTGKPLREWQARKEGGIADAIDLHPLILLPDREWLYDRCDRRFSLMLNNGAVEEVEALLARDLDPSLPVMRAIGVPQIAGWLRGEWDRAEAAIKGKQATRNYAKRQYTWFRRQPPEDWPRMETQNVQPERDFEILFRSLGLT
jgi:tRNA dimethylallyltransferase